MDDYADRPVYRPAPEAADDRTPFLQLKQRIEEFVRERNWEQYHSPKNLAMALAVEAGELLEIFSWMTEDESRSLDEEKRQAAAEEISDVMILALNLTGVLNVDAASALWDKLEKAKKKYPAEEWRDRYE